MADSFLEEYKPGLAMVAVQCIYAAMALSAKAAFTHGMSPMVFVIYRQASASLVVLPINTLTKRFLSLSRSRSRSLRVFDMDVDVQGEHRSDRLGNERLLFGVSCFADWVSDACPWHSIFGFLLLGGITVT